LVQLAEEGAVQVFQPMGKSDYILGAVGVLQFDVTAERLRNEYGADTVFEETPYNVARWVECADQKRYKEFERENGNSLALDAEGRTTFLTSSEFRLERCMETWPDVTFLKTQEYN
jgi:peptide chain release factor 3